MAFDSFPHQEQFVYIVSILLANKFIQLVMVYNLYSEVIIDSIGRKRTSKFKSYQVQIQTESLFARILIKFIRIILFVYDVFSLPVYFLIQRPDKRAKEAQKTRSECVDINTWIKTGQHLSDVSYLLNGATLKNQKKHRKYLGSTLNEIFANSIKEYKTRPCLGYRAVVTCPILVQNEEGEHLFEEKSFRSDYTWYTYEQVGRRVQDIASGLYHHSMYPGSRALFLASTSLEWFLASQACFQLAAQIVVAPEINDPVSVTRILKEAEIDFVFISCDRTTQLNKLFEQIKLDDLETYKLKKVILIDWLFSIDFNEPTMSRLGNSPESLKSKLLSLGQVEEYGVENPIKLSCTKYLSDDIANNQHNLLDAVKSEKTIGRKISHLFSRGLRLNDNDELEIPSTVPLQRRIIKKDSKQNNNLKSITLHDRYQMIDYDQKKCSSSKSSLAEKAIFTTLNEQPSKPDDIAMIVYSHGSLGQIKATILSHHHLARSNHHLFLDGLISGDDIHCTTLFLNNVIEFMTEMCLFCNGGSIGYSSDLRTLFYDGKDLFKRDNSDLEVLNPTLLLVRPYILESLRASLLNYLTLQYNPLKSFILTNLIYDYKKYWARRHFSTPIVDKIFCSELKHLFGKNLKYILCNGATDCSETKDFFAFIVNIPVIELYGPDEAIVSLISVNDIWDYKRRKKNKTWFMDEDDDEEIEDFPDMQLMPPKVDKNISRKNNSKNLLITSSILCPTVGTRIRLEDWEDFRTSDLPYPRGRMLIGGDIVSKGYFNNKTSTEESFYVDSNFISWFRTDDIARVFPNGSLEIISDIKDIIKMVDGQVISLSQIEHIVRNSQFVDNVCAICGDDKKFILALVVPNLKRIALKLPKEVNLKTVIGTELESDELLDIELRREICNERLLCEFVSKNLSDLIAKAGFQAIPSRFHLVPEIWTPETELVTPSFEPKRATIQSYYATDIQSIVRMNFKQVRNRLSSRFTKPKRSVSSSSRFNLSDGTRLSY